jgi:polyisoprenoid-binding protein YceI
MRTSVKIALGVGLVVVLLAGAGIWWFLRDDAPAAVDLQTAVGSVSTSSTAPSGSDGTTSSAAGIDGTWTVDNQTGDFDYESASGTFAGFRIGENLASFGSTTAVGRTGDVTGSITIEGTTLTAASFEVDLATITTNESRRDDKVQSALSTNTYPTATFTLTAPVELGASAASGEAQSVTATGDLTIHGVTHSVQMALDAQLVDGTIVVVGSTDITFADYGVAVLTSPIVVSADDHGVVEVQLLLTRG